MKLLATTLAVLTASASLHAIKLAGDEFQRNPVTGNVNGNADPAGTSFGWSGNWTANTSNPAVTFAAGATSALAYNVTGINVPASGTLSGVNSAAQIVSGNNITDNNILYRSFATAPTGATRPNVYVSFIYRYTSGTFADTEAFYVWLGSSNTPGNTTHLEAGFRGNGSNDIGARAPQGTAGTLVNGTGGNLTSSTTTNQFVILKITADNNNNYNRITIFSNPTGIIADNPGTGVSFTQAAGSGVGPTSLTHLGFGIGGLDTGETFQIDQLQVGTTWQDVITPVPFGVDSTAGLALLGLASAWKLRRRRSKA